MPSRANWSLFFTADMVSAAIHDMYVPVIGTDGGLLTHVLCMYIGIVKTHNLGFQECEALQAVFVKDLCPNHIIGPSRLVTL